MNDSKEISKEPIEGNESVKEECVEMSDAKTSALEATEIHDNKEHNKEEPIEQNKNEETKESNEAKEKLEKQGDSHAQTKNEYEYKYEDGAYVYTDESTGISYVFNNESQQWVEKEKCFPADKNKEDYEFDGETYCYTDPESKTKFKWNLSTQAWEKVEATSKEEEEAGSGYESEDEDGNVTRSKHDPRSHHPAKIGKYDAESGTYVYRDPKDGNLLEWDPLKCAWFPKVDEDFLAAYQMSYGFVDNVTKEEEKPVTDTGQSKKKKEKRAAAWFDASDQENKNVYVENLPCDITEEEFVEIMSKCGIVVKDLATNKYKVKLYKDENGQLKGDALCSYMKIESVELALQILDGYDVKGKKLKVQRAKFSLKGEYNPALKPKRSKKDKEKILKSQERLLAWIPDKLRGQRGKHEKVVIIKNLFDADEISKDPKLLLDLQQQIRDEVSRCGRIKKVVVHDKHVEGVAQVFFSQPEEADMCIQMLNKRLYRNRRLTAETWDGTSNYRINETKEEEKERLSNWEEYLKE